MELWPEFVWFPVRLQVKLFPLFIQLKELTCREEKVSRLNHEL